MNSRPGRHRMNLAAASIVVGALLLAGCSSPQTADAGAGTDGTPSPSPKTSHSATPSASDDLDFDGLDDLDFDDEDFDFDDLDDLGFDLDDSGLDLDDLGDIDDDDVLKDFLQDAHTSTQPENAKSNCIAVHPGLYDILAKSFSLAVDDVRGAKSDAGNGYFLAADLEDGQIAVLYTVENPTDAPFTAELLAVDDIARATSTYAPADDAAPEVMADGGASRVKTCF